MSALDQKRSLVPGQTNVCFAPKADMRLSTNGAGVAQPAAEKCARAIAARFASPATASAPYFFLPAGTPHQMILAKRQKFKFIAFETHQ